MGSRSVLGVTSVVNQSQELYKSQKRYRFQVQYQFQGQYDVHYQLQEPIRVLDQFQKRRGFDMGWENDTSSVYVSESISVPELVGGTVSVLGLVPAQNQFQDQYEFRISFRSDIRLRNQFQERYGFCINLRIGINSRASIRSSISYRIGTSLASVPGPVWVPDQ